MLTPAIRASRTSEPCVIISNALATHVCPLSFFERLPFDAAMTSGLTPPVFTAGACPNSGFVAAATTPAAVVVCTNSRRLIFFVMGSPLRVRRAAFVQRVALQRLRSVLRAHGVVGLIHRHAGVFALCVQAIEAQAEVRLTLAVQQPLFDRVLRDALQRRHR